ncbi:MAG: TaqI-like C-terminal specificity domain-containing protein [Tissierellia bacterium]|nr:TaqI-like C-terminal specificity domain-containing protein [Tissierellia bacterium]
MPNFSIDNLIADFSVDNLIAFFRSKISSFNVESEDLSYMFDESKFEKYISIDKIGEATIDSDELIIICSKILEPITETTGKKRQYDIAKKVLKQEVKDAAFFIFYDDEGNFRFSFVRANYLGNRRDFTDFKRYTYFVSPALTNNTFKMQIENCNFNTLDEIIEAFSVEPLNKQFYQEIAKAFYTLIGGTVKKNNRNIEYENLIQLPSTPINSNRRVYQEFGVRLIGRIIFCWFLKNKKSENGIPLVPESWLSSKAVVKVNEEHNEYYHNILEKLFFLVLNRNISERMDYLLPDGHELIPFLNGGLFDPHVNDFFISNQPNFALVIPNEWFLELFEVLEQFNFTIDENSIFDAEVSIDPEMLGTIFENLLAEIDPDTEKSARNATGSFYTPREIVDYMVEQSLIQYLKTKANITNDEALELLFKEGGENMFNKVDTENILQALSEVKILDPACGSGAFPMGAVSKIIKALKKLDHGAKWWREQQIRAVPNVIARRKLKEKLDASTSDYARKLGVIQNSIYGVDIQPVAAEISKLRCFLSLVIDENIDDNAVNRGIEPLPNLEFKFVTANTLIDLAEKVELKDQTRIDFGDTESLQVKLQEIRNSYLQAYGEDKETLKKEFKDTQNEIFNHEVSGSGGALNKRALQLAAWNPFGNESSEWFNPEWMFGVDKFDIVIGNPPYVSIRTKSFNISFKKYYKDNFHLATGQYDLYVLFMERVQPMLNKHGILNFIIPTRFLSNETFEQARLFLYKNCRVKLYLNAEMPFEAANVEANSLLCIKDGSNNSVLTYKYYVKTQNIAIQSRILYSFIDKLPFSTYPFIVLQEDVNLINKIMGKNLDQLGKHLDITRGFEFGYNHESIHTQENDYPLLKSESINRYIINNNLNLYVTPDFSNSSVYKSKSVFKKTPKLVTKFVSNDIIFAIDNIGYVNTNVVYNCHLKKDSDYSYFKLLGFLNTKLVSYWFKITFLNLDILFPHIQKNQLEAIILPKDINWRKIEDITKQIMEKINNNDDVLEIDLHLNIYVYKHFCLLYNEVKLIDPEFPLTQTEYENYIIE